MQLVGLQNKVGELRAAGGTVLAVSVDRPEQSRSLTQALSVMLPLLSDPEMRVIRAYGVEHPGKGISLPAVFVIGTNGRIAFRHVAKSLGDRPSPDELVFILRRLAR